MSDDRAFDEPLPWLAPVEDEDEPRGISARKMLAALLVVLLAAAIVAATFFWVGRRNAAAWGVANACPSAARRRPAAPQVSRSRRAELEVVVDLLADAGEV